MEWDDPIGRVCDHELVHPQLPPDVGLGWAGTALGEMLQDHGVPGEREEDLGGRALKVDKYWPVINVPFKISHYVYY